MKEIYIFKVTLKDFGKIWRRIAVRGEHTLDKLHQAIFAAFDRYDEHLYSFYLSPPGSKGKKCPEHMKEYTSPFLFEDGVPESFDNSPAFNAAATKINRLSLQEGYSFDYLFDFGDEWKHTVLLEKIMEATPGRYPQIIEKHGDSPPQYPAYDEGE